jgi:xanthine dehydrogenase YagS FAD-binding subunit
MVPFRYVAATDPQAAADHGSANGARYLAGGTTLVDLMKLYVERPAVVVDINAVPLTRIEELPDGGVRVGAMVRNSDMAHHELIRSRYPLLSQAIAAGASAQVRNMATTGGNLLQRTRCYYFRDTAAPCNKREPGSGCAALDGHNRIHAVLGVSDHCIATHPSDMCVALAALDAVIRVTGPRGPRAIPFSTFHLLPDDHPERETALAPGELITSVDVPALSFAVRSTYVKVRDRASYAFALASAAVAIDVRDGTIRDARIALGGVATKPWRAHAAERALAGARLEPSSYRAAAEAALDGAVPRTHNRFKIELARRTIVRALARAGAMA